MRACNTQGKLSECNDCNSFFCKAHVGKHGCEGTDEDVLMDVEPTVDISKGDWDAGNPE